MELEFEEKNNVEEENPLVVETDVSKIYDPFAQKGKESSPTESIEDMNIPALEMDKGISENDFTFTQKKGFTKQEQSPPAKETSLGEVKSSVKLELKTELKTDVNSEEKSAHSNEEYTLSNMNFLPLEPEKPAPVSKVPEFDPLLKEVSSVRFKVDSSVKEMKELIAAKSIEKPVGQVEAGQNLFLKDNTEKKEVKTNEATGVNDFFSDLSKSPENKDGSIESSSISKLNIPNNSHSINNEDKPNSFFYSAKSEFGDLAAKTVSLFVNKSTTVNKSYILKIAAIGTVLLMCLSYIGYEIKNILFPETGVSYEQTQLADTQPLQRNSLLPEVTPNVDVNTDSAGALPTAAVNLAEIDSKNASLPVNESSANKFEELASNEAETRSKIKTPNKRQANSGTKLTAKNIQPVLKILPDVNGNYFAAIEEALILGDPAIVAKRFEHSLSGPISQNEVPVAVDLKGRFYLLVSKPKTAEKVYSKLCKSINPEKSLYCLNYVRTLVTLGKYTEADNLLDIISNDADTMRTSESQIGLLKSAINALGTPSEETVKDLLYNFTNDGQLNAEWSKQRNVWLARSILQLKISEQKKIARLIYVEKREVFNSLGSSPSRYMSLSNDPLIVPFFQFLAQKYEYSPFPWRYNLNQNAVTDYSMVGQLFHLINRIGLEPTENLISQSHALVGKRGFSEISSIIAVNLYGREGEWHKVRNWLRDTKLNNTYFSYEWALILTRLSIQYNISDIWDKYYKQLIAISEKEKLAQNDFLYWYLLHKLELNLNKPAEGSLKQMQALANTQTELGLLKIEEASKFKAKGDIREAAKILEKACEQVPFHALLLQTTAEIVGQVGGNPTFYIDQQSLIPDKYLRRGSDIPPISEVTLLRILEKL